MGTRKHNIINDLEGAIMKTVSLIMGLACTILSLACLVVLILNVSGDCDRMTNLLCCLSFIPLSVLGADGCYKGLKGVIRKKISSAESSPRRIKRGDFRPFPVNTIFIKKQLISSTIP